MCNNYNCNYDGNDCYNSNNSYYYVDIGVIAGGVAGALAALALIGGGIAFYCVKKRQTRVAAATAAPPGDVVVHTPVVDIQAPVVGTTVAVAREVKD